MSGIKIDAITPPVTPMTDAAVEDAGVRIMAAAIIGARGNGRDALGLMIASLSAFALQTVDPLAALTAAIATLSADRAGVLRAQLERELAARTCEVLS